MRPIDAYALKDYFHMSRDETSCEGCEHLKIRGCCYEERLLSDFCSAIDEQQTIDAVPVVRCKDCKWYGDNWISPLGPLCTCTKLRSGYDHLWVDPDFYCGYGKRLEHGKE